MTIEREGLIVGFLKSSGWENVARKGLAGDASMRRYERLIRPNGETVVLMDAPPEINTSIQPFVTIARHLLSAGLSAPQIHAVDVTNGLMLIEDLGDGIFARVAQDFPLLEPILYQASVDILVSLHQVNPPELAYFDAGMMTEQASLVFQTWVQKLTGSFDKTLTSDFCAAFQALLSQTLTGSPVMILRDFHAENLLWLPDRRGVARVGLLDFQDAMLAHPGYDLVSLLQDVRRDVPRELEQDMLTAYILRTGQDDASFRAAYAVLGVQRNLRILAVFARLASSLGKPFYASLIPRTWGHIMRGLANPALAPIASLLIDVLPEPSETNLQKLIQK